MSDPVSNSAPSPTRILLGGGGSAEDERPIFERFAAWVGGGHVLYLPIAADQPSSAHLAWLMAALAPLGVQQIDMWTTLAGHQPAELRGFAGIFIGGGNTYWLLHQLRTGGFNMRVYVPFGTQWYPYLMRRLAERPANIAFIMGNVVKEAVGR